MGSDGRLRVPPALLLELIQNLRDSKLRPAGPMLDPVNRSKDLIPTCALLLELIEELRGGKLRPASPTLDPSNRHKEFIPICAHFPPFPFPSE